MKSKILSCILVLSCFCCEIQSQEAPVTSAPYISDAVSGSVNVQITATGFSNIGSVVLTLLYDPLVLEYSSAVPNAAFVAGNFTVISSSAGGGLYKITISYPYGEAPVTLADGSTVVTVTFLFSTENEVNHSSLTWFDDGTSCEYSDASDNPLTDTPQEDHYIDGIVASQVAPVTILPTDDFYTSGNFQIIITATDFDEIGTMSLAFEYDSDVIGYMDGFTSVLTGLEVSDQSTSGTNHKIVIGWFGDPVTIADGNPVVSLDFNYISGETALDWINDGYSCEYSDGQYLLLYDSPFQDFFQDGIIGPTPAPIIKADTVDAVNDEQVIVPLRVWQFNNINSMDLALDFNPDDLTFMCATIIPELGGAFDAAVNTPGRITMQWTGDEEKTVTDEQEIIYLTFIYHSGSINLTWYNDGATCQFTTGPSFTPLPDEPTGDFYLDGRVIAAPGPAVWTGSVSTAWNEASNWQSSEIPLASMDVNISDDPLPSYWPVYDGDLTIGSQCRNITLSGVSELSVTGDLSVDAGHKLDILDDGIIKVGGDWINQGMFETGTGSVEFYGSGPGQIDAAVNPGDDLCNYTLSPVTKSMTFLSGGTVIPSGDDVHTDAAIGFDFTYLDVSYSTVRISSNGWISMNNSGDDADAGDNSLLFFATGPSTVIAPWWDDLYADGGSVIQYLTEGTAPNRVFTVEWKNILSYSTGATARLNFQVKLFESSGNIGFCYGDIIAGTHSPLESASIGVKDAIGGTGRFIEGTSSSTCCINTCLQSDVFWPSDNYLYSPPPNSNLEIFWNLKVTKEGGGELHIARDTHVVGIAP